MNETLQKEIIALKDCFVPHPFLLAAHKKVRQALLLPEGYGVVLVVGPPGAGKSALAAACRVSNPAVSDSPLGLPCDTGAIPLVSVAARTGNTFLSRWKGLLLDILAIVNPPLEDASKGQNAGRGYETYSVSRLESAVINSLKFRKTVGLLVDEAQDLEPFDSEADSVQMARSLKHLGSVTSTVLVLFGGYTMLRFLNFEAQLSRRCSVVHLPRYDISKPVDKGNFQSVVLTFCEKAPTLLPYAQLVNEIPTLYTGSAGGTGNLRLWLLRAAGIAAAQSSCVTKSHLMQEKLVDDAIKDLFAFAQSGESMMTSLHSGFDALMASVFAATPFKASTTLSAMSSRHRMKPGKRSLQRDAVGEAA